MFKKTVCAVLLSAVALLSFASCSNNAATMKDGEYRAEFKDFDEHGWKEYVVVKVEGGKYASVEFDAVNKDDNRKKSTDADYANAYPADVEFVKPAEYSKTLADALVEKQDIQNVDVIATATGSSNNFKKLVNALNTNIRRGKTDTVIVTAE